MFSRTTAGKIAEFLFYTEVLVWVEGPDDVVFYEGVLRSLDVRLEAADGREEIDKLTDAIVTNGYPFVVIRDGDYDILFRSRSPHRRAIYLNRYSSENYFFEPLIIEQICRNYCQVHREIEIAASHIQALEKVVEEIKPLLILDIAHTINNTGYAVLPNNVHALLEVQTKLLISANRLASLVQSATANIDPVKVDDVRRAVESFLIQRELYQLINGHLLYSAIRFAIIGAVERRTRRKPNIDDKALRALLAKEVWGLHSSADHRRLARRIRRAVHDAEKLRPNF